MENKSKIQKYFNNLVKSLRLQDWAISLEFVEKEWKNTGNIKIDVEGKSAIVYLNIYNPKQENYQEVLIHELCHLKLWNLDQMIESLINAMYGKEISKQKEFVYDQFMVALESTTEDFARCFLPYLAENKSTSFGRCAIMKLKD